VIEMQQSKQTKTTTEMTAVTFPGSRGRWLKKTALEGTRKKRKEKDERDKARTTREKKREKNTLSPHSMQTDDRQHQRQSSRERGEEKKKQEGCQQKS
jgi:hypothetical protein